MDIPADGRGRGRGAFLSGVPGRTRHPPPTVPRTRLLIADLPPLLGDIVRDALAGEGEVDVVGRGGESLDAAVDATAPDVVLAQDHGPQLPDPYLRLMLTHPTLQLLTVSADGRHAALWRLAPERRPLADVSPRGLAGALRDAARRRAGARG